MRFSFDAESYRNRLAGELKEKRADNKKEEAMELLKKEQETLAHKVSQDIKKVLVNIKEKKRGGPTNTEKFVPEKVFTEVFKIKGSEGAERTLEVQTLDVNDSVPDGVKLLFDLYRLAAVDIRLKDLNIGPKRFEPGDVRAEAGLQSASIYELLSQYIFFERLKEKEPTLPTWWSEQFDELSEEEKERVRIIQDEAKEEGYKLGKRVFDEIHDYINIVTDGASGDEKSFFHVVTPSHGTSLNELSAKRFGMEQEFSRLTNRFPHSHQEKIVQEQEFNIHDAQSDSLWFNAGGSHFSTFTKVVLLCNSRNERLREEIKNFGFGAQYPEERFNKYLKEIQVGKGKIDSIGASQEDEIEAALKLAGEKTIGGIRIDFKKKEPWIYIADWIVDLYHGKVYKISEVKNG